MERETRFELATLALARRCSTTELLPLSKKTAVFKVVERNVPLFLPLCPEALSPPLVDHYGLLASHNSPGRAHENGDIEQSHYRFKRAVAQALKLRGTTDFATSNGRCTGELNQSRRVISVPAFMLTQRLY